MKTGRVDEVKLGTRTIGPDYPPYVIAEAAISHMGDLKTAEKMVYIAKAAGCDAIKFQMHILDNEMLLDVPTSKNFDKSLYETLQDTELSLSDHKRLMDLCDSLGIQYLCTPFSKDAVDILDELGVVAFKIGSGEITNKPLVDHIISKRKPIICSSGMCELAELDEVVRWFREGNAEVILLHCISAYPTPYNRVNLDNIPLYSERYKVPIGLSDHSIGIYTSLGAVSLGACVVEKHYTLDKLQDGPDHPVSLEPLDLFELVKGVNACYLARGSGRTIFEEEKEIVAWARESVVSEKFIPAGSRLARDNCWVKRPGPSEDIVPAKHYDSVIGKRVIKDIEPNRPIRYSDIEDHK